MAKDFQIRITADDRATATIKKIEAVIAGFTAPIEKAQRRMDFVKSKLEAVGDAARNAVSSVASIIPGLSAIGGIASVAGLTALASKFASFGYNVSQTSNLIGVSARELQAWQIVGQKAHMTADEVSSGLMGMNDAIRGAALGTNSTAAGILTQLGVTIKKNKDGSIDYESARRDIVNAIANQKQASGRVAAANALGVPLKLVENKNVASDLAAAMNSPHQKSQDAVDRAREMQERIDRLKQSIESVALTIGDKLVPVLQPAVEAIGQWFDANKEQIAHSIANAVERFTAWMKEIDWESVTNKAQKFWDMIGGITGAAIVLAGLTFAGPIAGLLSIVASLTKIVAILGQAAVGAFFGLPGAAVATGAGLLVAADVAAAAAAGYVAYKAGEYLLNDDRAYHGANPELRGSSLKGRRTSILPTGSSGSGASAEDLMKYLMDKGWTKAQAAGIVGSLMVESSLNPDARNGNHYGLAQWDTARQADFEKWSGTKMVGTSWQKQADFLHYEMTEGKEKAAGDALRNQKDAESAARVFNQGYERPGASDMSGPKRESYANQASQISINVTAPQGTRVEAKDSDGKNVPARVNYSMATDGSMP